MSELRVCKLCGRHNPPSQCSLCRDVFYCNSLCQNIDWKAHKSLCSVTGIRVEAQLGLLSQTMKVVPHSLWLVGAVSPISVLVGFPVRLIALPSFKGDVPVRVTVPMGKIVGGGEENITKWSVLSDLMLHPILRESPMIWKQMNEATVIREDHKILEPAAFELIATYCSNIAMGQPTQISPVDFAAYCIRHKNSVLQMMDPRSVRYIAFRDLSLPL